MSHRTLMGALLAAESRITPIRTFATEPGARERIDGEPGGPPLRDGEASRDVSCVRLELEM